MPEIWPWIMANADGIEATAVVASAIAAFLIIWHNRALHRRQETILMVHRTFFGDEERQSYSDFKSVILSAEEAKQDLTDFAAEAHDRSDAKDHLLRQLNEYELISLGIKEGVFDERFYKRWFFTQFTRDFAKLRGFIIGLRDRYHNDAYFCEFESLARRWNRKKHPVKHPPRRRILWWIVSGQMDRARRALEDHEDEIIK